MRESYALLGDWPADSDVGVSLREFAHEMDGVQDGAVDINAALNGWHKNFTTSVLKVIANGAHSLPGAPEVEPHQHTCRE